MEKFAFSLLLSATLLLKAEGANAQSDFLINLCQRWQLDVIEIKDSGRKYPPDEKMKNNYLLIRPDGTFTSSENGLTVNGKWQADEIKRQLTTSDFDNQNLTSSVIFTITSITKYKMALAPAPTEGLEVNMHYYSKKVKEKKRR